MSRKVEIIPTGMMRYALYRRVSSDQQVERDLSLPEQKSQQHEYVAREGGVVAAEYEDAGISGSSADARPAFLDMIAAAKRGEFDIILVHKSDRAFRNKDEASTYRILTQKIGVRWASVTERFFGSSEPADKLLTGIMESVNEFYRDNLKSEIKKGIRSAGVAKGRQHGMPPYGYRWAMLGKRGEGWAADEIDAPRVVYIYEYMAQYSPSLVDLARHINALGWPAPGSDDREPRLRGLPRRGTALTGWLPTTLRRILSSRTYLGKVNLNGAWLPGSFPPLIEQEVAMKVFAMIGRRSYGRSEETLAIFGGGLLRCPVCAANGCDTHLYAATQQKQSRTGQKSSLCASYACGLHIRQQVRQRVGISEVAADGPDDMGAFQCSGFRISETRFLRRLLPALTEVAGGKSSRPLPSWETLSVRPRQVSLAPMQSELDEIPKLRRNYDHLFASERMDIARYDDAMKQLEQREAVIRLALDQNVAEVPECAPLTASIATILLSLIQSASLTPRQRRDGMREYVDYFVPLSDDKGIAVVLYA